MTKFLCDDGNCEVEIEAASPEAAAQGYVETGDWGEPTSTIWITVYVTPVGGDPDFDREAHTVEIDPDEPSCESGEDHQWKSPIELVGGLEDNPGVFGHGGGVVIHEVCQHCGCSKTTDTWAQNPETGEQGLQSVSYDPNAYPMANPEDFVSKDA
jgi:hypothetical protein